MLQGTPPPWLRKALASGDGVHRFDVEDEVQNG
jgi:hypothetical protein